MAERSIRDFEVGFAVAPVADAWAVANGFGLHGVEPDGSRHYVRGSGLLTGQMMCVVRQWGTHVRVEAYIHARLIARLSAFFLIPENKSIEPGGIVGVVPRKICRDAVDKLLAQLGQPPITAADNASAVAAVAPSVPAPSVPAAGVPAAPPAAAFQPTASGAPYQPAAPAAPYQPAAPAGAAVYPAAVPYPPVAAFASPGYLATAARPVGIAALAIAEIVNAFVCLPVAADYWSGFNWRAYYDDMNWAALDLAMVAGYVALAGASIAVAWRLWSMRRDAWLAAIQLGIGMVGITILSGAIWGFELLGVVGIVVHSVIIGYVNTAAVRAALGRNPVPDSAS